MAEPSLKCISFELKRSELIRDFGMSGMTQYYKKLEKSFNKNGFKKKKQSMYISELPLTMTDLKEKIVAIIDENKWMLTYSHNIDYYNAPLQSNAINLYNDIKAMEYLSTTIDDRLAVANNKVTEQKLKPEKELNYMR